MIENRPSLDNFIDHMGLERQAINGHHGPTGQETLDI